VARVIVPKLIRGEEVKASPWLGRWQGALLAPLATLALASPAWADVNAAVGGVRDPAAGALNLRVQASETSGVGLRTARAALADQPVVAAHFGDPSCAPAAATTCPATGGAALTIDTTAVADGVQRLVVTVEDGAGNLKTVLDRTVRVANTRPPSDVTLRFGGGIAPTEPADPGGSGGVAGEQSECRRPRLAVALTQRPLWVHQGRAVLAPGRRYRFSGRLTCRVDGRRRSAPRGTQVELRRFVRGRMIVRSSARVRARGRFVAQLRFRRSMVVAFRFRGAGGRLVQVRLPVIVTRFQARGV
jgi:hypothetical protein